MPNKTVTVLLTNKMRLEIHDKVMKKTFEARIQKADGNIQKYAQELVNKFHSAFFGLLKDPNAAKYLESLHTQEGDFRYTIKMNRGEGEKPVNKYSIAKTHTIWTVDTGMQYCTDKNEYGRSCEICVRGPRDGAYSHNIMAVEITKQQEEKIKRLVAGRHDLVAAAKKFSADLRGALFGARTLTALYTAMPELKSVIGLAETKVVTPTTALTVTRDTMLRELKNAGLLAVAA